jgi:uncharacterized membrane protein
MNVSELVLFLIVLLYLTAVVLVFRPTQRSQRKASTPADRPRTGVVFRDDDRYWYGGFFYNNPDDPDPFVPKRYGLGWTVNFGHPVGKLVLIAMLLLGLVLPLVVALLGVLFPGLIHSYGCHPSGCHW